MTNLSSNILIGAHAIAGYDPVIGDLNKAQRVYDLYRRHRPPARYPIYKRGGALFARKTEIDAFYAGSLYPPTDEAA